MQIIIIAAVSKNGVIGKNGKMPWHSKEELKFFRETTLGYPIIMGKKTFEQLAQPLGGRENIILSKKNNIGFPAGCVSFFSIAKAFEYCMDKNYGKCFVIGGGKIFEQVISLADKLIISEMEFECSGNVFFPKIDPKRWNLAEVKPYNEFNVNYYTKIKS